MTINDPINNATSDSASKIKVIVTHQSPDLDAIASVWLLQRFLAPQWEEAQIVFLPSGEKLPAAAMADLNLKPENLIHVDTGLGEFDHHQPDRAKQRVCAASLVFDHICRLQTDKKNNQALRYLVNYFLQIDLFENCYWPQAADLKHQLMVHSLIEGAKLTGDYDDQKLLQFGMQLLDAAYLRLKAEVTADEIIQRKGERFQVAGHSTLAIATGSKAVEKRSQMMGTELIIRKNEKTGHARIKATPRSGIDLTPLHDEILKRDQVGNWFLHGSKRMLLNGSGKSDMNPTSLSLTELVSLAKSTLS